MKKYIFLVVILVAIVASSNVGFAQTDNNRYEIRSHKSVSPMVRNTREASSCAEWGTFTNFSATDMNGVTHNIQSYLNQGKYVVIEFFRAWCSPCWQYYQGGILEELYNTYGDGGTGEFVVLMVEDELTNTEAQITGTTTSQDYAGMSQGDFTNGGTNPVPIIDATENLAANVSLYEGYVPSVYLFCPAGYVFDIYTDEQLITSNEIYNFATRTCQTEESLPDIGIVKPDFVRMGETATFSSCVISLTDVTYAWTFEDGTPETSTDANVDVVWDTPGMHRISLTVANENGQVEHPDSVYVFDCTSGISTFPFVEDFENGQGCWTLESANTVNEITIGEYSNGMNGLIFSSYDQANNYNQYFISPELHHASALNLSFKYKKHNDTNNQSTGENFYVKYSTTTSDISSFITLGSMITANSNSWETYTGTLPADAKYFMINYNTDYQYYLLVDDLTIEMAAYWSCDFEDEEMWTFGNDQQNGNVQWQIVTPETFPSNLISGTNAYFNPFVFQGDTLNETPEHWAMVELISQLTDLGGPGQVAESPWIEFSGIDLSEAQHPKITFRQMFRQLNGIETIVMVSADGQTWTEHNLNEEVESNQYGQNSITKGVNIYEAAGAENVTIRFLVNSDASVSQMGYGWQIDDIKILEAPACDLTLNAARISMFGYVDYRNLPDDFMAGEDDSTRIDYAYQLYDPYAQSPRQQWFTQNGFAAFNIEILNNGYDTITPKARVKVFNPNGDLIYDKIAEGTFALQSDQSDTLDLARNTGDMENSTVFRFYVDSEDEIAPGRYNVEFEILTDDRDEDNTDNYSTQYFYITDSRYSPSYDQPNGYFWPSNYGTEVGTYFTYYYEPDRDVKVDAYIDAHTTAETQLQAIVYMYNNEEYTQVLSSDIVNITEDMLGSWVNFSFNGAFNVTFDEGQNSVEYLITIKTIEGTLAIGSYNLLTNKGKRTRIKNGDTWYYLGKNAAIRLREFEYAITVESSNTEYGTVSGSGEYDDGSEVIITAMPKQGYRFLSWNDGNTENPRTITVTSDSTFVANFVEESESSAVYWRCTFEESTPLYTMGQITASDANWELQTISESAGANYYYNLNSYGENHPYGEVSETPEHWMMIDGDGANQDGYDFDSYLLFSGIDLSDAEYPQICFYEYSRRYNIPTSMEATVIEVSTDGGATWTRHVVGCEEMTTEAIITYRRVLIPEAAGYANVTIRFRANRQLSVIQASYGSSITYESGAFIVNWQVDDIVIKATPAFDLAITDVRMNDGICDYYSNQDYSNEIGTSQYNYYQFKPMFGQTPRSEWTSPNKFASFNVAVENRGYETVTPIVHISVTSPSGVEIWNVDFTGDEIEMEQCDTIDVIEYLDENQIDKVFRFTEEQMQNIEIGEYIVTYSVSIAENEDLYLEGNVRSHPFYITESGYSPATPNITTTSGPNRWASFEEGGEILAVFEYNVLPEDEIPLYVYISENTEVGTAIAANIYEYNEVTSDFEISFTSGRYTTEEDDLGTWINIPFETPLILSGFDSGSETKKIRVGIAFYENGNNELHIGASEEMPNKGWICLYDMNGEGANYVNVSSESAAPSICLGVPFSAYTINVLANNDNYGYVTGSGIYEEGTEITLTAMPYQGYRFVSWNDNITDNPRTITVTSDSTFVAMFEAEQVQQYTITVLSSNDAYGSVSGGGTYEEGTDVIIMAMPNGGYLFDSWEDDNAENPRTITVTSDSTFVADFVKCEITQTIDTTVNNFVTVGNHTFYSTGNYSFAVLHETDCDTIFDINLTVLAEPVYDIGPNPTEKILNITSDGFISYVEFYSPTGQLVMRKEVNGYEAEFDMECLVDGVYIVRIFGDESNLPSVYKIVKE